MLLDMIWREGNLPTGHRTTVRTGLPSVFWRLLNQGVSPSKSTTVQIDEATGMLEAWSEVDVDLAKRDRGGSPDRQLSQRLQIREYVGFSHPMTLEQLGDFVVLQIEQAEHDVFHTHELARSSISQLDCPEKGHPNVG
jgi:hypothetical protein